MDDFLWAIKIVTAVGLADDGVQAGAAAGARAAAAGAGGKVVDAVLVRRTLLNQLAFGRLVSLRVDGAKSRFVWI